VNDVSFNLWIGVFAYGHKMDSFSYIVPSLRSRLGVHYMGSLTVSSTESVS